MPPVIKLLCYFAMVGCGVGAFLFGILFLLPDFFAATAGGGVVRNMGPLLIPVLVCFWIGWAAASKAEEVSGVFSVALVIVGSAVAAAAAFGVTLAALGIASTTLPQDRIVLILSLACGALAVAAALTACIEA